MKCKFTFLCAATMTALCGAAHAQSSVTLYGLIDASIVHTSGNGQNNTRMIDGTEYGPGSRWGLRGVEDLGGGLKAKFTLEAGFLADTGNTAQGGRGFGRQSFIALQSDKFGEFRLGRQYMLHDETLYSLNPTNTETVLSPSGIYTIGNQFFLPMIDASRIDNALHYLSPTWGGFSLQAIIAAGEKTNDRYHGIKANYANGPLEAIITYEQSKALNPLPNAKSSVNKIWIGGATYDFGPVKAYAAYQHGKDLTTGIGTQLETLDFPDLQGTADTLKAATIGAAMPIGAKTTLIAIYTHSEFSHATDDVTVQRYGFGAKYALSKRTALYTAFAMTGGDLKHYVNEKRAVQAGMRHSF